MKEHDKITAICSLLNGFSDDDWQTLETVFESTKLWIPDMVYKFFDVVDHFLSSAGEYYPETKNIKIRNSEEERFQIVQNWLTEILSGKPDDKYWQRIWLVGLVHVFHSIKPLYIIGIMSAIQNLFLANCNSAFEKELSEKIFAAFKRITDTTAACIIESNIYGLTRGMLMVGMNESLINNIKTNAVKRLIKEQRSQLEQ
ncbi:hypothetical protein GF337_05565 [candidate division KSB1 bacterium]|nr:hypothetical protein [candidate division KSB1 bacterium]